MFEKVRHMAERGATNASWPELLHRLRRRGTGAMLALAVLCARHSVLAQDGGWSETLTLSGQFHMQPDWGVVGDDLASVIGRDNGWTVTLYDVYYNQYTSSDSILGEIKGTGVVYGSGLFEFTGPDAALLNSLVSPHLTEVTLAATAYKNYLPWPPYYVWDPYNTELTVSIPVGDAGVSFNFRGAVGFRADDEGYPVLWSCWSTENWTTLYDGRDGNSGSIASRDDAIGVYGDPPSPPPPPPLELEIADVSANEGNRGDTSFGFLVELSTPASEGVSVDFRTVAGTALDGTDFIATSGTLWFAPGETVKTITVRIKGDRTREPDETFLVELFNAVGAPLADANGVGTILNDDVIQKQRGR